MNAPKKKKWAAVGIVTLLSIGFGRLLGLASSSMREGIIERENLGDILVQIEQADIKVSSLAMVLREPPPLVFILIATFISIATTVWFYHKILGYLCKSNRNPNQSSEPT